MCDTRSVAKLPATYLTIHSIYEYNERLREETDFLNTAQKNEKFFLYGDMWYVIVST
jgi:hypothetical protein